MSGLNGGNVYQTFNNFGFVTHRAFSDAAMADLKRKKLSLSRCLQGILCCVLFLMVADQQGKIDLMIEQRCLSRIIQQMGL